MNLEITKGNNENKVPSLANGTEYQASVHPPLLDRQLCADAGGERAVLDHAGRILQRRAQKEPTAWGACRLRRLRCCCAGAGDDMAAAAAELIRS